MQCEIGVVTEDRQLNALTPLRQGFLVPDVGSGADCGETRAGFQRTWLHASRIQWRHYTVVRRFNSSQLLLDPGERGASILSILLATEFPRKAPPTSC